MSVVIVDFCFVSHYFSDDALCLFSGKEHEVEAMEIGGNKRVNDAFEAKLKESKDNATRPIPSSGLDVRDAFIKAKYRERLYFDPSKFQNGIQSSLGQSIFLGFSQENLFSDSKVQDLSFSPTRRHRKSFEDDNTSLPVTADESDEFITKLQSDEVASKPRSSRRKSSSKSPGPDESRPSSSRHMGRRKSSFEKSEGEDHRPVSTRFRGSRSPNNSRTNRYGDDDNQAKPTSYSTRNSSGRSSRRQSKDVPIPDEHSKILATSSTGKLRSSSSSKRQHLKDSASLKRSGSGGDIDETKSLTPNQRERKQPSSSAAAMRKSSSGSELEKSGSSSGRARMKSKSSGEMRRSSSNGTLGEGNEASKSHSRPRSGPSGRRAAGSTIDKLTLQSLGIDRHGKKDRSASEKDDMSNEEFTVISGGEYSATSNGTRSVEGNQGASKFILDQFSTFLSGSQKSDNSSGSHSHSRSKHENSGVHNRAEDTKQEAPKVDATRSRSRNTRRRHDPLSSGSSHSIDKTENTNPEKSPPRTSRQEPTGRARRRSSFGISAESLEQNTQVSSEGTGIPKSPRRAAAQLDLAAAQLRSRQIKQQEQVKPPLGDLGLSQNEQPSARKGRAPRRSSMDFAPSSANSTSTVVVPAEIAPGDNPRKGRASRRSSMGYAHPPTAAAPSSSEAPPLAPASMHQSRHGGTRKAANAGPSKHKAAVLSLLAGTTTTTKTSKTNTVDDCATTASLSDNSLGGRGEVKAKKELSAEAQKAMKELEAMMASKNW